MNIKPEQIPDEVVEAAMRAEQEFYAEKRYTSFSGIGSTDAHDAMKAALAAALPVLLERQGYRIDWFDTTYRGKSTISSSPCGSEDGRSIPLYSIRTQDTPNEQ